MRGKSSAVAAGVGAGNVCLPAPYDDWLASDDALLDVLTPLSLLA